MNLANNILKLRDEEYQVLKTSCYTTAGGVLITDPFDENTAMVKLYSLVPIYYEFGENPLANLESQILPERSVKLFAVSPGSRLSLMRVQETGLLNIVEYAHVSYERKMPF